MRGRRLQISGKKDPEINVGSFADVAFLLIIFFILTTTFNKPKGQEIELPRPDPEQQKSEETVPTVVLTELEIMVGEERVHKTREEFKQWLDEFDFEQMPDEGKRVVMLTTKPDVSYSRYFDIINLINKYSGVVSLMQEQEGGGE
jgi:biopolymer transport protein ExbD